MNTTYYIIVFIISILFIISITPKKIILDIINDLFINCVGEASDFYAYVKNRDNKKDITFLYKKELYVYKNTDEKNQMVDVYDNRWLFFKHYNRCHIYENLFINILMLFITGFNTPDLKSTKINGVSLAIEYVLFYLLQYKNVCNLNKEEILLMKQNWSETSEQKQILFSIIESIQYDAQNNYDYGEFIKINQTIQKMLDDNKYDCQHVNHINKPKLFNPEYDFWFTELNKNLFEWLYKIDSVKLSDIIGEESIEEVKPIYLDLTQHSFLEFSHNGLDTISRTNKLTNLCSYISIRKDSSNVDFKRPRDYHLTLGQFTINYKKDI